MSVQMMMKMENQSHGHKNKVDMDNIWSSIHEKVKQHWGWFDKSVIYKKSVYVLSKL